jgi:MFS family permease
MASKKAGLNYSQIGLVFGINPLGSIVMSVVIGGMMMVWGRKKCLIASLVLQSCVQVLFGCLNFMTDNKGLFIAMSMITRILQGASR